MTRGFGISPTERPGAYRPDIQTDAIVNGCPRSAAHLGWASSKDSSIGASASGATALRDLATVYEERMPA